MAPIAVNLQASLFCLSKQGYRKFLAGACFVSSGILFYLYLGGISVPCWGQVLSKHPRSAGNRKRETAATPVGKRSAQTSER